MRESKRTSHRNRKAASKPEASKPEAKPPHLDRWRIWNPHDSPPSSNKTIRLRFDDDGSRDSLGWFDSTSGCYFKLPRAKNKNAVHPVLWREIDADELNGNSSRSV
jgi:hypothetical protein